MYVSLVSIFLFLLLSVKQVEATSSYRIRTTFQLRSRVLYSPWNEASDISETLDFYWLNHTSMAILGSRCSWSPAIDTDFVTTEDKSTFWDQWALFVSSVPHATSFPGCFPGNEVLPHPLASPCARSFTTGLFNFAATQPDVCPRWFILSDPCTFTSRRTWRLHSSCQS